MSEDVKEASDAVVADDKVGDVTPDTIVSTKKEDTAPDVSGDSGDKDPYANWREMASGDDEKLRKTLDRFGSIQDLAVAYREIDKLRGSVKVPFPEKGTDEEKSSWREKNGVPESPDKYDISLESGFVFGEEQKPGLDLFLKRMHERNLPNSEVKNTLQAYAEVIEQEREILYQGDTQNYQDAVSSLKKELGPEYKMNEEILRNWAANNEELVQEVFLARDETGRRVIDNPSFVKTMMNLIRAADPASTVAHMSGGLDSGLTRLQELREMLRENPQKYYANPKFSDELARLSNMESAYKKTGKR